MIYDEQHQCRRHFSGFCEILISDCLNDVIQSTAQNSCMLRTAPMYFFFFGLISVLVGKNYYHTSEVFFLCKTTVDKLTQNELLTSYII